MRSKEHLDLEKENPLGEIKTHLKPYAISRKCSIDDFQIIKKCSTDQKAKINEAISIKKENTQLNNKNLSNRGSMFTVSIYY